MKNKNISAKHLLLYIVRIASVLPTIFLLLLIFGFSAQDGETSGSLSFKVSLFLVRLFSPLLPASTTEATLTEYAEFLHLYVRKAAHMTEYFLLALSLQLPLAAWFSKLPFWKTRILTGLCCTVFLAALDEFHQTFVPGRSGNFTDICIDSIGAIFATLCLFLIYVIRKKKPAR